MRLHRQAHDVGVPVEVHVIAAGLQRPPDVLDVMTRLVSDPLQEAVQRQQSLVLATHATLLLTSAKQKLTSKPTAGY